MPIQVKPTLSKSRIWFGPELSKYSKRLIKVARMNEPIISVSGLRGIIGQSLDPVLAIRYAVAYVSLIEQDGPIIVTRDGRTTGSMLASGICSGIAAAGRDVLYGDVAATPTTGVLVRQHKAAGAIQISASHNPPPYNGMKLFGTDGRVIPGDEGEKVITAFREIQKGNGPDWQPHDKIGTITNLESTTEEHLKLVLATVDVAAIKAKKYKVVLDSNHGAGSCLLYTSPSPRDQRGSRMPSSA